MKYIKLFFVIFLLAACAKTTPTPTPQQETESTPAPYEVTIFEAENQAKASQPRLDDPRPNIIFIFTDDQPYHTVQFMPTTITSPDTGVFAHERVSGWEAGASRSSAFQTLV